MDIDYPSFGTLVVDGTRFDHDVVLEDGGLRKRDKSPSRKQKVGGHTPLSSAEDLPWSKQRLLIGTGYSGRLPVLDEVREEAASRGVALEVMPTADACALLKELERDDVNAVLHVTC